MLGRFQNYLANEGAKLLVLISWLGINAALFYSTFLYYYDGPQFYYLHNMLGYGLCISRATAACINLNACIILLPMCRNTLRILRSYPSTYRVFRRLLDRSKSFHIACGYMICLMAVIHCGAHGFNAFNFSKYFNSKYTDLNVAAYANQHPFILITTSVPGITGISMAIVLTLITYTALKVSRSSNYRRFWKIHHLFIAFYILLLLHACSGVLKFQTNISEHIPGCFIRNGHGENKTMVIAEPEPEPEDWNLMKSPSDVVVPELQPVAEGEQYDDQTLSSNYAPCQQAEPKFQSCSTEAWRWLFIPLALYAVERISRYFAKPMSVTKLVEHPNNVVEIEFFNPRLKAKPGQSIWIRCPSISATESHPFTLTSVPTKSNPYFTIHMSVVGVWTSKIKEHLIASFQTACEATGNLNINSPSDDDEASNSIPPRSLHQDMDVSNLADVELNTSNSNRHKMVNNERVQYPISYREECNSQQMEMPLFYADGPYGTPMQDVFGYSVSVCVAGGIGITPYAAVLNMIKCQIDVPRKCKLRRMYLIWICRTVESFRWFIDLINIVQKQLWNRNMPDFLNVYLHVTSGINENKKNLCGIYRKLTRCRLVGKRPNFEEFFTELSHRHQRTDVGVFCCGPKSLNSAVRRQCLGGKRKTGVKFIFNKESF